jgi:UDP-N-acetylmuramoyl-tripeptide--D-alanyl-D-alanine ligase
MIASILGTRWRVFKSRENKNIFRDTKRYASQIKPHHRAVVLEYGMIYPGRIRWHCSYVQPNMGVITMVGMAHIGNFGSLDGLLRAKSELIKHMNQKGTLFLNADDQNSKRLHTKGFKGKIVRVGIDSPGDYQARDIEYKNGGMRFKVKLAGAFHDYYIPIPGEHNVYNALFAIAVADRLGFSASEIRRGLKTFKQLGRRLKVYRCSHGVRLIDDSFSANPNADKAALDVLRNAGRGRKIAVLGTMLELPRACVMADEIAQQAEFFSFGTNDLTQTTLGFSRDDAESKFIPVYLEKKVIKDNPFAVLDRKGVGSLMKLAVAKARGTRPGILMGICGEHGGEPSSIEFCHLIGLDYVSCSPYRIPIARLAAAQAQINNR